MIHWPLEGSLFEANRFYDMPFQISINTCINYSAYMCITYILVSLNILVEVSNVYGVPKIMTEDASILP
jgi:hypothetical protein